MSSQSPVISQSSCDCSSNKLPPAANTNSSQTTVRYLLTASLREGQALHVHAMPSHAMPSHAMPSHAMPSQAMPCQVMPCQAMPCQVMPCQAMPCQAMPCHAMPRGCKQSYTCSPNSQAFRPKSQCASLNDFGAILDRAGFAQGCSTTRGSACHAGEPVHE